MIKQIQRTLILCQTRASSLLLEPIAYTTFHRLGSLPMISHLLSFRQQIIFFFHFSSKKPFYIENHCIFRCLVLWFHTIIYSTMKNQSSLCVKQERVRSTNSPILLCNLLCLVHEI